VDYVHAYQLMPRIPFTYTISPGADSRYPDSNQELNNGKLGPIDLTNSEWTGIIGQPGYYIDIIFNTTSPISIGKITLHSLRHQASGIFLPTKIELYCLGAKKAEWKVRQTSEDGLYQVVLDKVPPACLDSKLRLYNDWWTFLSEITINPDQPDTTAPSIAIIQPDNGATILPPRYSAISGTSWKTRHCLIMQFLTLLDLVMDSIQSQQLQETLQVIRLQS
jgi:hypothetical protein